MLPKSAPQHEEGTGVTESGLLKSWHGEKTPIEMGDVVLTPGWCWHELGDDGDVPAYWLDGLDVPFARTLRKHVL